MADPIAPAEAEAAEAEAAEAEAAEAEAAAAEAEIAEAEREAAEAEAEIAEAEREAAEAEAEIAEAEREAAEAEAELAEAEAEAFEAAKTAEAEIAEAKTEAAEALKAAKAAEAEAVEAEAEAAEAAKAADALNALSGIYSSTELQHMLRSSKLTYFRHVYLGGHVWCIFEVRVPHGWWALVQSKEQWIQFLEEQDCRPAAKNFKNLMSGSKPLPYPLAMKVKGHFDIAGAIAGADSANEEHWSRVYTVKIQSPERLTIESCSWTLGAMLREPVSEVDAAVGDVLLKINGWGILWQSFDDIQELLIDLPGTAEITFGRPKVIQKIYLREAVASAEALSLFCDGVDGDGKVLVSQLAALLSRAGLVFAEDRPGLFAGDAGTASHLHVDRKPLLQFCHGLHGCKFFCVAPGKAPGPQVPWQSGAQLEAKLPTDAKLSTAAVEWMQSPEVSVCCLHPGDLLLFLGQSCHAGCNGAAQMSLSLFHGTMPLSYMLQGAFGVPYQLMARKLMS